MNTTAMLDQLRCHRCAQTALRAVHGTFEDTVCDVCRRPGRDDLTVVLGAAGPAYGACPSCLDRETGAAA